MEVRVGSRRFTLVAARCYGVGSAARGGPVPLEANN